MTHLPKKFSVADPRTFDGDPFEVAERGILQMQGVVRIVADMVKAAKLMARNAELERRCLADATLDAEGWPETAEGRRWEKVEADLKQTQTDLALLARVASYNPRKPPKE